MSEEYKQKQSVPDCYHMLGLTIDICKEPDCDKLIQQAYVKKAKICHPDKYPGRTDIAELFELITAAYDILKDESSRVAYNHKLAINKQSSSDFIKLKKSAKDYTDSLEYKPATEQQKLGFKEQMKALDNKHGVDNISMAPIDKQDAKKKLKELEMERSRQDMMKPENLFGDGKINMQKFNAIFDAVHQREETSMVAHGGAPAAWNNPGSAMTFSTFDNLDNLYVEDSSRLDVSRQNFSGTDFGQSKKITKAEADNIDASSASYFNNHNVLDDNYYREMKEKLKDRNNDATTFEKMRYNDFKRDDTAGYGIFDQLGFKVDNKLALDVDEDDLSAKYERLMAQRNEPILPGQPPMIEKKKQSGSR